MIPTGESIPPHDTSTAAGGRPAGVVIAVASVLTLAFFSQHPSIHSHDLGEVVSEMSRLAMQNMLVHGALIAMMAALVLGFWCFADHPATSDSGSGEDQVPMKLVLSRHDGRDQIRMELVLSRGGLVAYALGALMMIGAATVNGFIVTGLALTYRDVDAAKMEPLRALLVMCHTANATFDVMGIVGMSLGVALWSLALLLWHSGGTRLLGILGLLVSVPIGVMILTTHAAITIHGMGAFLLGQVVWNLAIATQMVRGRI